MRISGTVNISVKDEVIETAHPGAILGEMALLEDSDRSASAIAAKIRERVSSINKSLHYGFKSSPISRYMS